MSCREDIAKFCSEFLLGNHRQIHEIINAEQFLLSKIDIQDLSLSEDTFNSCFKEICKQLFGIRPSRPAYITAVLGFALRLKEYHYHNSSWYTEELLIETMTDVMEEIDFELCQFIYVPRCLLL